MIKSQALRLAAAIAGAALAAGIAMHLFGGPGDRARRPDAGSGGPVPRLHSEAVPAPVAPVPGMRVRSAAAPAYTLYTATAGRNGAVLYSRPDAAGGAAGRLAAGEAYPGIGMAAGSAAESAVYTVKPGDTLAGIAGRHGIAAADLLRVNGAAAGTSLAAGRKLLVPPVYVQLQLLGGRTGWVRKSSVGWRKMPVVLLGWNASGSGAAEALRQSKKANLNTVSPRWFSLNAQGAVTVSGENAAFVRSAHNLGKRVWPLMGNLFDPVRTGALLSGADQRRRAAERVRDVLLRTGADGVNIDYENIDPANADGLVAFVKELSRQLKPHGKIVSMDVTRSNGDPFWSASYKRGELGRAADYLIMMGYEEHWGGSSAPGSVGSLPWVEDGLLTLMKEVPAHKILLGVPFYTRDWVTDAAGGVTSADLTMAEADRLIARHGGSRVWLDDVSQHYASFMDGTHAHQLWLEDADSLRARFALVRRYRLGGVAAWYLGAEHDGVWQVLR